MSRKDYIAIAAAIKARMETLNEPGHLFQTTANVIKLGEVKAIAESLADTFAADNPRFDRSRFFKACGMKS